MFILINNTPSCSLWKIVLLSGLNSRIISHWHNEIFFSVIKGVHLKCLMSFIKYKFNIKHNLRYYIHELYFVWTLNYINPNKIETFISLPQKNLLSVVNVVYILYCHLYLKFTYCLYFWDGFAVDIVCVTAFSI